MDMIFKIFLVTTAITIAYGRPQSSSEDGFINIPADQVYTDPTSPVDKSNLQSSEYQDFIRQLYRFDDANLQKFENQKTPTTAP